MLSPDDRAVFDFYPRKTTLRWGSVPGAATYSVEINWCQAEEAWILQNADWCREGTQTMEIVKNLAVTSYTFEFVGANPGQWRVWAVDGSGAEGPKSPFRLFRYTH